MDSQRRKQLEQRRKELQQKLHKRERAGLLSHETAALDRLEVDYDLVYQTEALWDWLRGNFPPRSGSIDWSEIPDERYLHVTAGEEMPGAILDLLLESPLDENIHVLYPNGRRPAIRLSLQELLKHYTLLNNDFEVWFVCQAQKWVLEYISPDEWCWGTAG